LNCFDVNSELTRKVSLLKLKLLLRIIGDRLSGYGFTF
jgi:hypothetical protein